MLAPYSANPPSGLVRLTLSGNSWPNTAQILAELVIDSSEGRMHCTLARPDPEISRKNRLIIGTCQKRIRGSVLQIIFHTPGLTVGKKGELFETTNMGSTSVKVILKKIVPRHIFYLPQHSPGHWVKTHIFGPRFLQRYFLYLCPCCLLPNKNPSITNSRDHNKPGSNRHIQNTAIGILKIQLFSYFLIEIYPFYNHLDSLPNAPSTVVVPNMSKCTLCALCI